MARAPHATERVFRLGFVFTLGALTAFGLVQVVGSLSGILLVLAVSLFTAIGLQPVIDWLIGRGLPRAAASALVTLTLVGAMALFLAALVPLLVEQASTFARAAPGLATQLRADPRVAWLDRQYGVLDKATAWLASGDWLGGLFGFLGAGMAAAGIFGSIVLATVLSVVFTWTAPQIKDAIYQLAPASKRPRVRYLATEIFDRIGDYLLAMLVVAGLWGVGSFVVLNVVGLGRYSLALALMTMALVMVPAIGSTVAGLICALIAWPVSAGSALGVAGYFIVYQQLDAYLVQPRLFARTLRVPPALVILGVACGLTLLGVLGAMLAIPFVASLLLLYREIVVPALDGS